MEIKEYEPFYLKKVECTLIDAKSGKEYFVTHIVVGGLPNNYVLLSRNYNFIGQFDFPEDDQYTDTMSLLFNFTKCDIPPDVSIKFEGSIYHSLYESLK